jgi:hypothetical protein
MKRLFLSVLAVVIAVGLLANVPAVGAFVAHAQAAASLTATVDRNNLTIDETFMLTLTLFTPDASMPQLTLPALDGFRVIGNSQSVQTSLINGAISTTVMYTYQLQPDRTGDLTIPGLSLDWNGQTLTTDVISISVSQGNGASNSNAASNAAPAAQPPIVAAQPDSPANRKGSHDLFIETATDKQSLYVGEALKFSMRLYNSAMSFGQPDFEPPQFVGFWHPQKPDIRQYYANGSDGTLYDVTELSSWLFPTTPGQATIDPATVTTSGGYFTQGAQVQSDPISIEVKPLPAGAPADFTGAVGQFEIIATPDRLSTRLGEPVTLQVELSGSGNWGTLGDPKWPGDPNWRVYDQETRSKSDIINGQMTGSRRYQQLWTPLAEGKIAIPAIQYIYFDPAAKQYKTITTQAQIIDITSGDPGLPASLPQNTALDQASDMNRPAASLQIKSAPAVLTSSARPLTQQTGFLLLFLVPAGLVMGDLSMAYRKHYLATHAAYLRRSQAYKRARRQLQRIPPRSKNVQLEVARIMLAYLTDQIQQPLAGLSHSALAQVLQANHISPDLAQRVIETLFTGEASEYTPRQPASHEQVVRSAMLLLEDLEKSRS